MISRSKDRPASTRTFLDPIAAGFRGQVAVLRSLCAAPDAGPIDRRQRAQSIRAESKAREHDVWPLRIGERTPSGPIAGVWPAAGPVEPSTSIQLFCFAGGTCSSIH